MIHAPYRKSRYAHGLENTKPLIPPFVSEDAAWFLHQLADSAPFSKTKKQQPGS
jgi:hypothetical protein